jgi:hypothetical protein
MWCTKITTSIKKIQLQHHQYTLPLLNGAKKMFPQTPLSIFHEDKVYIDTVQLLNPNIEIDEKIKASKYHIRNQL